MFGSHICTPHACLVPPEEGIKFPKMGYRRFWLALWVLKRVEPEALGRAANVSNRCPICLSTYVFKSIRVFLLISAEWKMWYRFTCRKNTHTCKKKLFKLLYCHLAKVVLFLYPKQMMILMCCVYIYRMCMQSSWYWVSSFINSHLLRLDFSVNLCEAHRLEIAGKWAKEILCFHPPGLVIYKLITKPAVYMGAGIATLGH